jgi:hypothetical protein
MDCDVNGVQNKHSLACSLALHDLKQFHDRDNNTLFDLLLCNMKLQNLNETCLATLSNER